MAKPAPAFPTFGEFVKTQRALAQLSLRQASEMARISNPYLSQIEHGWVLPSVTVMNQLAETFSLSVETMMKHAAAAANGEPAAAPNSTEEAIQQDPRLSVEEKKALLLILASFTNSSSAPQKSPKRATKAKSKTTTKGESA